MNYKRPPRMNSIEARFNQLDGQRSTILTNCEQYAEWTLPYLFPRDYTNTETVELQNPPDSIGARGVNHLANKVTTTLFRPQGPFFKLKLGATAKAALASQ